MKKISKELLKTYYWVIVLFAIFSIFIIVNFSVYLWKENQNDIKVIEEFILLSILEINLINSKCNFEKSCASSINIISKKLLFSFLNSLLSVINFLINIPLHYSFYFQTMSSVFRFRLLIPLH